MVAPKNLNIPNSNSKNSQIDRYKIFSKQVQKANKDKANIIILCDDNINSLEDFSLSSSYSNIELKNLRDELMIENSLFNILTFNSSEISMNIAITEHS